MTALSYTAGIPFFDIVSDEKLPDLSPQVNDIALLPNQKPERDPRASSALMSVSNATDAKNISAVAKMTHTSPVESTTNATTVTKISSDSQDPEQNQSSDKVQNDNASTNTNGSQNSNPQPKPEKERQHARVSPLQHDRLRYAWKKVPYRRCATQSHYLLHSGRRARSPGFHPSKVAVV